MKLHFIFLQMQNITIRNIPEHISYLQTFPIPHHQLFTKTLPTSTDKNIHHSQYSAATKHKLGRDFSNCFSSHLKKTLTFSIRPTLITINGWFHRKHAIYIHSIFFIHRKYICTSMLVVTSIYSTLYTFYIHLHH